MVGQLAVAQGKPREVLLVGHDYAFVFENGSVKSTVEIGRLEILRSVGGDHLADGATLGRREASSSHGSLPVVYGDSYERRDCLCARRCGSPRSIQCMEHSWRIAPRFSGQFNTEQPLRR